MSVSVVNVVDIVVVVGIRPASLEQLAALLMELWLSVEQLLRTALLLLLLLLLLLQPDDTDGYDPRPPVDGVRGFDPGVPGVGRNAVVSLDGGLADSADAGC